MKTVREIADGFGVSTQTIYNHIHKNKYDLAGEIKEIKSVQHISDRGVQIIKQSLGFVSDEEKVETLSLQETVSEIVSVVSKDYQGTLLEELSNRDEQLKDTMLEQFKTMTESIQSLLIAQEEQNKLINNKDIEINQLKEQIIELKKEITSLNKELEIEKNKSVMEKLFNK